jgi:hypothetical protein
VTLRARLSVWFALFAALPLLLVFVPVSAVLHHTLTQDHAARLDAAAQAVDGELLRLAASAADGVRDLAPPGGQAGGRLEAGPLAPPTRERLAAWRGPPRRALACDAEGGWRPPTCPGGPATWTRPWPGCCAARRPGAPSRCWWSGPGRPC